MWRGIRVQGAELEDTATMPNKSGSRLPAVADSIRRQCEREERNRQLREAAWEAGLVFRRGNSLEGDHFQYSVSNAVSSSTRPEDSRVLSSGDDYLQDVGAMGIGLDLNIVVEEQVSAVDGGDTEGEQVLRNIGAGH